MRLGIIARSDNTGLGNQTRELVDMLKPDKILLINSSFFNQNRQHPEWYAGYNCITTDRGFPRQGEIKEFLRNLDVVISCETFYSQQFIDMARLAGIKTILQYNYEFLGNLQHPDWSLPDVLLAPSTWHINDIKNLYGDRCEVIHLPPPTDAELFKDVRSINAQDHKRILHIAGKAAVKDRNGTETVIQMLNYSTEDYKLVIKTQTPLEFKSTDERIIIETDNVANKQDLYSGYDAMVLPRRYAGLCLPMNEALMSGLPVFMPKVSPNTTVLPDEWTLGAKKIDRFKAKATVDVWSVNPQSLARLIDNYIVSDKKTMKTKAFDLGFEHFSRESLKEKYINIINS
jgi:hypothetical protein